MNYRKTPLFSKKSLRMYLYFSTVNLGERIAVNCAFIVARALILLFCQKSALCLCRCSFCSPCSGLKENYYRNFAVFRMTFANGKSTLCFLGFHLLKPTGTSILFLILIFILLLLSSLISLDPPFFEVRLLKISSSVNGANACI